jgi:hypothetical protein
MLVFRGHDATCAMLSCIKAHARALRTSGGPLIVRRWGHRLWQHAVARAGARGHVDVLRRLLLHPLADTLKDGLRVALQSACFFGQVRCRPSPRGGRGGPGAAPSPLTTQGRVRRASCVCDQ